ncbi:MAG: sigma-70 family RNA polymerase sigma factor [Alphaproteobacteria bacterium]|nr:sigma-70 family RNA polymerase sigma factor [Alphaproteobacteria bacterium]
MENWNFCFYAVKDNNKLVYGFDDETEAKFYSEKNKYELVDQKGLKELKIDPENYDFWSDDFQEFNEEEFNRYFKEKLVVDNLKLVAKIARDFKSRGSNLMVEDLISAGNMGLMEASERYNNNKVKFSVFASYYIKSKIREEICKFENSFSVGRAFVEKKTKLNRMQREENVGVHEITKKIGMKNRFKINSLLEGYQTISLDDFCNDDEKQTIGEVIPDTNNHFESMEKQELIDLLKNNYKSVLNDTEALVFEKFYMSDKIKSQKELAKELGISCQNFNVILKRALKKVREMVSSMV